MDSLTTQSIVLSRLTETNQVKIQPNFKKTPVTQSKPVLFFDTDRGLAFGYALRFNQVIHTGIDVRNAGDIMFIDENDSELKGVTHFVMLSDIKPITE